MLKFLKCKRNTACFAEERLQIVVSHQNSSQSDSLIAILQEKILKVVQKHISISPDEVSIYLNKQKSTLQLSVNLPEQRIHYLKEE
ncbi:MAG: cell division topological specificity factor MinE [Pseudomonadota bacterium]|nr:cell division topological specificity factor MinE [Pseudomonadota bacterium]